MDYTISTPQRSLILGPLSRVHFGESLVNRLYSEIDQTYLSIEALCVSHHYPRWTATIVTNTHLPFCVEANWPHLLQYNINGIFVYICLHSFLESMKSCDMRLLFKANYKYCLLSNRSPSTFLQDKRPLDSNLVSIFFCLEEYGRYQIK